MAGNDAPRTLDVDDLQMTGVARVTAGLRIASLNPALAELLATGMKRWIGAPLSTLDDRPPRLEQAAQRAFALTIEGFSASAAAKAAAQGTAYSKSEVYKQLLLLQQTAE